MSSRSKYEIARAIVVASGGTPRPSDSFFNFLQEWLRQEGGTPMPSDNEWQLLRRICVARGETPQPIDGTNDLLRHMSGLGAGYSNREHLEAILALIEGGSVEPPAPTVPNAPTDLALFTSNGINDQSFMWTDNADDETGLRLYGRDVTAGQAFIVQKDMAPNAGILTGHLHVKTMGLPSFTDGHQYEYYIVAYNAQGESAQSNLLAFTWAIA